MGPERSIEQLAILAGISFANTSRHLQVLRRAGMVEVRRDGARTDLDDWEVAA